MPNTITLPDPPSDWNALTKDQLIYIHSLPRTQLGDAVYKMKVFLHLCGLELCNESFYDQPAEVDMDSDDISTSDKLDNIQKQIKWMDSVINGTANITVVLRSVKSEDDTEPSQLDGKLLAISDEDLFNAILNYTKFLDEPYNLFMQPLGEIVLGKHKYKTPDAIFSNLTYEQFQNAQSALGRFWDAGQALDEMSKLETLDASQQAEAERIAKEMVDAQVEFLTHVLTQLQPIVKEEAVLDSNGKPSYTARGKAKIRQMLHLIEPTVDVDSFCRNSADEIKENAPHWLFPILYQHFQSSMLEHKKNFPKLFSGSSNASSGNPFVGTIATLNTLMHEQGYADQRSTLDANCVFNFQKLDELTRRAEEMEKINNEMKRKSHKR